MKMIVLDADYDYNKINEPVVRLYGKVVGGSDEGKDIILHVLGFEPYFYVDNCGIDINELKKTVEREFIGYVKRIEIVKRFRPIGYQKNKVDMLKIVLFNPRVVPDMRKTLPEKIQEVVDSYIYEADVLFKNRFMIDYEVDGMSTIAFAEYDNRRIKVNYGMGCSNMWILKVGEFTVIKDEVVKIEY